MTKLKMDGWQYKMCNIAMILVAIPSMLMLVYGMTLYTVGSYVQGYTMLLIAVSILVISISSVFDYIQIASKGYDWSEHIQVSETGDLIVRPYPFIKHSISLKDVKKMDIQKGDNNLYVTFTTGETELNLYFPLETYDTLLNIKQIYVIGW